MRISGPLFYWCSRLLLPGDHVWQLCLFEVARSICNGVAVYCCHVAVLVDCACFEVARPIGQVVVHTHLLFAKWYILYIMGNV